MMHLSWWMITALAPVVATPQPAQGAAAFGEIQLGNQAVLRVEDSDLGERSGEPDLPAIDHELLCEGKRIWRQRLPVALSHAALSERGTLVGQGYTEPRIPGALAPSYGCRVVMVRPDGTIGWMDDRERREMPASLDLPPMPEVLAITVHEEDDIARLYLKDFQERDYKRVMVVWPYRLETGQALEPIRMNWPTPLPGGHPLPLTARRVPGTSFDVAAFLIRQRAEQDDPNSGPVPDSAGGVVVRGPSICGLAVMLIAPDGEVVWTKELPGLYGSTAEADFQYPEPDTAIEVGSKSFTLVSRGRPLRTFHIEVDRQGKPAVIERTMPEGE